MNTMLSGNTKRAEHSSDDPGAELVRYTPGNCALLIGPAETLLQRLEAVRTVGLKPALLCTASGDAERLPAGLRALAGSLASLDGWMGRFKATLKTADGPADLAPLSFHDDGHFDWVLDFSGVAFARRGVKPPGYYDLSSCDYPALKQTLLEIARRMREGYDKPRYFSLDEGLCAHQRQSVKGCSACMDVCAASAISSAGEAIRVEPHLCQGCAACALACPSGAIHFAYPSVEGNLKQLSDLWVNDLLAAEQKPGLWIVPEANAESAPAGWLPFPSGNPASLGLEFWFHALSSGIGRVGISLGQTHVETRQALDRQIGIAQALLAGMGLPAALGLATDTAMLAQIPSLLVMPVAKLDKPSSKRDLLVAALDHLAAHAPVVADIIPLPAGSLFGAVNIATDKCTLCASCVRICPAHALSLPGSTSQLAFNESNCLQCGLCVNVCPEKAVSLTPRFLTSKLVREAPRVVAEAQMFECAGCGKPFATRAMIERGRAIMTGHPMFQGEQARLMELCPDCRQRAMAGVPAY
jgi:ferredoxin